MKPKIIKTSKLKSFTWHFIAVAIYMAWEIFGQISRTKTTVNLELYVIFYVCDITYFYFSTYRYLPEIYARYTNAVKRFVSVVLLVVCNAFFLALINTLLLSYLLHKFIFQIKVDDYSLALIRSGFIMCISFAIWQTRFRIVKETELNYHRERQLIAENEILQLENNLLRAKVNPHLFNNSLNSIYARMVSDPDDATEIIKLWVGITNYSFAQSDAQGKVLLSEDLENLENFISLQQLLRRNQLQLKVQINKPETSYRIIPLLMIDLVENMVKYGDLTDKEYPGNVSIDILDGNIVVKAGNKKINGTQKDGHGSGLKDLAVRLKKYYPDNHELNIEQSPTEFKVYFKLRL